MHVKLTLQAKKFPVSRFTGTCVDYSFVLWESTRSSFYSPYSVNVTATNELWEIYKAVISAKTNVYDLNFFPFSVIVTNTRQDLF